MRQRATAGLGQRQSREPLGLDPVGGTFQEGVVYQTEGWTATCACRAGVVPCTVLDPFLGSATTARQARALGRRTIGIELSPDYAEIAVHRTSQQSLFA